MLRGRVNVYKCACSHNCTRFEYIMPYCLGVDIVFAKSQKHSRREAGLVSGRDKVSSRQCFANRKGRVPIHDTDRPKKENEALHRPLGHSLDGDDAEIFVGDKHSAESWLTAAECTRRTGLTVRSTRARWSGVSGLDRTARSMRWRWSIAAADQARSPAVFAGRSLRAI